MIADRNLYLNADKSAAVEEGDPAAAFLLAAKGCELDDAEAQKFGVKPKAEAPEAEKPGPPKRPHRA